MQPPRPGASVLGTRIDALTWQETIHTIEGWGRARESRYVCICNAHSVVTATRDPAFASALRDADLATPDGAPVAWMLRRAGYRKQQRINGPDLMERYCERAARSGEAIYLYGATADTLDKLRIVLSRRHAGLRIAGFHAPPFRAPTAAEDAAVVQAINASGASVVWVGLGCPKQELWMAAHRGEVQAVMIGVGAAFDYLAGTIARAPRWMQHRGLEWLHRLASEPRRLWRRYLVTNSLFIAGAARQLLAGCVRLRTRRR